MGNAKFSYSDFNERVSFSAVGVEHQKRAIDIRGALKFSDFSKHGRWEIFVLKFYLSNIQSL